MAAIATEPWGVASEQWGTLRTAIAHRLRHPPRRGTREPTAITERLLQCIWYDGHFHMADLHLADGRPIAIWSPGRWNGEAGPDFIGAEIEIDGERIKGDVELHLQASGWRAHGHLRDERYRGVVLHVVLDIDDNAVADSTPTGGAIPRLALRPVLHGDLDALGQILSVEDFPYESPSMVGRCQKVLSRLDHDAQVDAFFEAAAERRIRAKMDRLRDQLSGADEEQVFYQALMTAMGHRGSKTLFFLLSKRVPLAELRSLTRPWSDGQRALAAQAVLLHVANLVPTREDADCSWDDETMAYLDAIHRVWAELGGHFSDRIIPPTRQWHRGMRPTAFPSRRVAGVSHVVTDEWTHGGVFKALARRCRDFADEEFSEKAFRSQVKTLETLIACEAPSDHWARRHTIGGKRLESPSRLIGQAQARSVIFNALLPLMLLHARTNRDRQLAAWAQSAIRHFPALAENTVTRFMKYHVFGTTDAPRSLFRREMRHQALFHIFTDCCDHSTTSCDQCAFFSRLPGKS